MLRSNLDPDDMDRIVSALDEHHIISDQIRTEMDEAVHRMIENLPDNLDHVNSKSTLDDFASLVADLGSRFGADPAAILRATNAISSRADRIRETESEDTDLSVTGDYKAERDVFGDAELSSLFGSLIAKPE